VPDTTLELAMADSFPPVNMVGILPETEEPKGLQLVTFDDGTYRVEPYFTALHTMSVDMNAASMIDVVGLLINIADANRKLN
jgi:hypothetical protein